MASSGIFFAVHMLISSVLRCNGAYDSAVLERDHKAVQISLSDIYLEYSDSTEDEQYTDSSDSPVSSLTVSPHTCDYDHCRDGQVPCMELLARTGCLCPGQSGPQEVPEAPYIRAMIPDGLNLWVHWCAPPSNVTHYRILAGGEEVLKTGERSRKALLLGLEPGTQVCVEALNFAGSSSPTTRSCEQYKGAGDAPLTLKVGLMVGALVLLLLLLSLGGFLLWRHRVRSSDERSPSRRAEQVP